MAVRFGAEVVAAATDHGDAASVVLASGETLEADAVVAADGAASAVRKSLEVAFDGMTYEDRYLVLSTPFDMGCPPGPPWPRSTTSPTPKSGWSCCGPRASGVPCSR